MTTTPLLIESRFPRTYACNGQNIFLGRCGEPIGMYVQHGNGSFTRILRYSSAGILIYDGASPNRYANNDKNWCLNRIGLPHGTCVEHGNGVVTRILEYEVIYNFSRTIFCQDNSTKLQVYYNSF